MLEEVLAGELVLAEQQDDAARKAERSGARRAEKSGPATRLAPGISRPANRQVFDGRDHGASITVPPNAAHQSRAAPDRTRPLDVRRRARLGCRMRLRGRLLPMTLLRLARTTETISLAVISVATPGTSRADLLTSSGRSSNTVPSRRRIWTLPSRNASSSNEARRCLAFEYVYTFIMAPQRETHPRPRPPAPSSGPTSGDCNHAVETPRGDRRRTRTCPVRPPPEQPDPGRSQHDPGEYARKSAQPVEPLLWSGGAV